MSKIHVINGDCLDILKTCPDNYFDSIVTDPPYSIGFMGKKWDYELPSVEVWKEVSRVLKPGGHILVACGTRTQHRMAVNIEDAGFEIRDVISWIYGSGMPKGLDISKAIDKKMNAKREIVDTIKQKTGMDARRFREGTRPKDYTKESDGFMDITIPSTVEAKQWDGWNVALKPAQEFFTLARKPLSEKTIVANVLKWGTGGINIDASRVGTGTGKEKTVIYPNIKGDNYNQGKEAYGNREKIVRKVVDKGRYPSNLITDGSDEILNFFPNTKSGKDNKRKKPHQTNSMAGTLNMLDREEVSYGDQGSAARFFYCPKVSKKEKQGSTHPTMKPIKLMEYLIKLITPPGGRTCDPYAGSGSTGVAAQNLGFECVLIEKEEEYCEIIKSRIK